jgi:hypothetical protein
VWPLGLCIHYAPLSVDHSSTPSFDGFGGARVFYFLSILFINYSVYDLIPNLIERLGLKWLSMFSVGGHIWVWILLCLYYIIYLAGLFEISVCLKGFLLWPLIGTEKVGNSPLAPNWYKEAPFCYYIPLCHYTDSYLVWRYGNWSHTIIHLLLFCKVSYQI